MDDDHRSQQERPQDAKPPQKGSSRLRLTTTGSVLSKFTVVVQSKHSSRRRASTAKSVPTGSLRRSLRSASPAKVTVQPSSKPLTQQARVALACDPCRSFKRKCSGELPCVLCIKRGRPEECRYDPGPCSYSAIRRAARSGAPQTSNPVIYKARQELRQHQPQEDDAQQYGNSERGIGKVKEVLASTVTTLKVEQASEAAPSKASSTVKVEQEEEKPAELVKCGATHADNDSECSSFEFEEDHEKCPKHTDERQESWPQRSEHRAIDQEYQLAPFNFFDFPTLPSISLHPAPPHRHSISNGSLYRHQDPINGEHFHEGSPPLQQRFPVSNTSDRDQGKVYAQQQYSPSMDADHSQKRIAECTHATCRKGDMLQPDSYGALTAMHAPPPAPSRSWTLPSIDAGFPQSDYVPDVGPQGSSRGYSLDMPFAPMMPFTGSSARSAEPVYSRHHSSSQVLHHTAREETDSTTWMSAEAQNSALKQFGAHFALIPSRETSSSAGSSSVGSLDMLTTVAAELDCQRQSDELFAVGSNTLSSTAIPRSEHWSYPQMPADSTMTEAASIATMTTGKRVA